MISSGRGDATLEIFNAHTLKSEKLLFLNKDLTTRIVTLARDGDAIGTGAHVEPSSGHSLPELGVFAGMDGICLTRRRNLEG